MLVDGLQIIIFVTIKIDNTKDNYRSITTMNNKWKNHVPVFAKFYWWFKRYAGQLCYLWSIGINFACDTAHDCLNQLILS